MEKIRGNYPGGASGWDEVQLYYHEKRMRRKTLAKILIVILVANILVLVFVLSALLGILYG